VEGTRKLAFVVYTLAPSGEEWVALGGPSLQHWAAVAAGRPCAGGVNHVIRVRVSECVDLYSA